MNESPEGFVGLAEAIEALRGELLRAWGGDRVRPLRFKPAPVELTVQVAVTNAGMGKAGIKWWLLDANVEVSHQNVTTQTLKLTLDPISFDPDGQRKEFLISDAEGARRPEGSQMTIGDPE